MRVLITLSNAIKAVLEKLAFASGWLLIVLMCITCTDILARKLTLPVPLTKFQELEWHMHTAVFSFWLGYNYVINAHPRVDSYTETLKFRTKAWIELIGCLLFAVAVVLADHRGQILCHHAVRVALLDHAPVLQPHDLLSQALNIHGAVRHEDDGYSTAVQLVDLAHAALAEVDVADRERFIHEQNVRVEIDCHGESKAHHHAAGIRLYRLADEVAYLGE